MGKNNAFASKPLAVSFLFYFNLSPRITIYMSHSVRRKLPGLLSSLTHNPSSLEQWPTAKIRAERLTGGGRAPGKGLARSKEHDGHVEVHIAIRVAGSHAPAAAVGGGTNFG